jgi:Ras-related protein Rab-8A
MVTPPSSLSLLPPHFSSQHADVNVNKILIGNKCDMNDQRVVSAAEGQALAKEYNIHFFETSAKQDTNVEQAFLTIATDVKNRMIVDGAGGAPATGGHKIVAGNQQEAKGKCC